MKLNGASLLTRGNVTFWIFETFRFRSTNGIGLGGNIQRERERERVCIWKRRERVTRVKVLVNYETLLPRSGVENCGPLRRGRDASRGNFRWKTTEFHEIREIRGEPPKSITTLRKVVCKIDNAVVDRRLRVGRFAVIIVHTSRPRPGENGPIPVIVPPVVSLMARQ